jgi:sensor histidine kinase YesM
VLIALFNKVRGIDFDAVTYLNLFSTFVIGVFTSHLFRNFIIRFDWLKLRIAQLIPRVLMASVVLSFVFYSIHTIISDFLILGRTISFDWLDIMQNLINLSANYILWTLLYWSFHFIENYRKEEIKNLRWQATINEMELNKIKSQLNPHFIFNSMNSIRAMVDENPSKAKNLITQLANILRSSLYMERKPVIPFREELSLVKDYLELEKARLESRLDYQLEISEDCFNYDVPPLLIQTLVENGIKHGISLLEEGGSLKLKAHTENKRLHLEIVNSGSLKRKKNGKEGIGLKISRQRLKLLYGQKAGLDLSQLDKAVRAYLIIPKETEKTPVHENTDS